MQVVRSSSRLCQSCSSQLLYLFRHGFCTSTTLPRARREVWRRAIGSTLQHRRLSLGEPVRYPQGYADGTKPFEQSKDPADIEAIVYQARQTFGDTLPLNFLTSDEYRLYERLYGPPSNISQPEDVRVLQEPVVREGAAEEERHLLFKEDQEGNLEEVEYRDNSPSVKVKSSSSHGIMSGEKASDDNILSDENAGEEDIEDVAIEDGAESYNVQDFPRLGGDGFEIRMATFRNIAATNLAQTLDAQQTAANHAEEAYDEQYGVDGSIEETQETLCEEPELEPEVQDLEDLDEEYDDYKWGDAPRTHPMTAAARSGTFPSTLQLPKATVVEPVMTLLRDASNKHLKEVAHKTFGGAGLPNSTATPSTAGRHLQQAPIALEGSQKYMGNMEANAYLAAIMPGAYASVMHILVEVRKRLGSTWLRGLMMKEGGPLVLDAGTAGAGVQTWREVLRAEWKSMHPEGEPPDKHAPLGKATVVTGSNELRHRVSKLLDNTTFLPRLPDYDPSRDHPTLGRPNNVQPRKQYDIIIAPHTLWGLREDYMRKTQVENFWSLLNPNGGVLVIIEKGVPRGFELVAAARELLLKRHIASTELAHIEPLENGELKYGPKEQGMIIAPCTNHAQCPMYTTPGKSTGRKDLCHFSQRFIRPRYLQTILGSKDKNHEDIRFSYIAVQRGVDQRQVHGIIQGPEARDAALVGYENLRPTTGEEATEKGKSDHVLPQTLNLPRTVLRPIKRRGHVILDLCTPAGRIERWTVPKSFSRQAYRDARKSQWGDLWALGAKTAIARNIRLGTKDKKVKGKDVYNIDVGPSSTDNITHVSGPNAKFEKRTKKGRKPTQRKKLTEDDL